MANASGLHALIAGVAQYLGRAYQLRPIAGVSCKFEPLGVSDLKKLDGQDTKVTLLLVRVAPNEHLRNRPAASLPWGRPMPLTVDLHLLVSVWADTALKEQTLLAWTLRELHQRPILDRGLFGDDGGFAADEQVALIPEALTLDELSKLWQVLVPPLRPSLGYVARNVRIDLDVESEHPPVVATRLAMTDDLAAASEAAR